MAADRPTGLIVCTQGCCAGCQDCYGYGIGCHQDPCRCEHDCNCRWADEDDDPKWRDGCARHDSATDRRGEIERSEPEFDEPMLQFEDPCPTCGERGPCGYDQEGRVLVHPTEEADDGR